MTNVVGTQTLLDAAQRAGRRPRFVHVSTDEVYGSIDDGLLARDAPAGAELAVLGVEGRQRPDRPRLRPHPRDGRRRHPLLEQLRALPVPGEGHPAVRHQPARRQRRCRCTATAPTSATGCTSTTTAAASSSCWTGGRAGEIYNIGGGTELTNRSSPSCCSRPAAPDWASVDQVDGPQGPRPALLGRHHQDLRRARLPRRRCRSRQGLADTVQWYRDNRAWWEPLKRRAALAREPAGSTAAGSSPARAACSAATCSRAARRRRGSPALTRAELDITDAEAVAEAVHGHDVVVTAPPGPRSTTPRSDEATAFAVNAVGPANLARACARARARLVQVCTDYVFAGDADDALRRGRRRSRRARPTAGPRPPASGRSAPSCRTRPTWSAHGLALRRAAGRTSSQTMAQAGGSPGRPSTSWTTSAGQPTWTARPRRPDRRAGRAPTRRPGPTTRPRTGETTWHGLAQEIFARYSGPTRRGSRPPTRQRSSGPRRGRRTRCWGTTAGPAPGCRRCATGARRWPRRSRPDWSYPPRADLLRSSRVHDPGAALPPAPDRSLPAAGRLPGGEGDPARGSRPGTGFVASRLRRNTHGVTRFTRMEYRIGRAACRDVLAGHRPVVDRMRA